MPVPSTPNDLITLIREKLYDNTSGIIEEDTLRSVLENIIKVLDAKFSFFSPTLTEEQYAQWNLMLDYMLRETKGVLTTSSIAPTEKGKYLLSGAGTFTNLGGLVTTADKLNYAYFDGTTWKLIDVEIPNDAVDNLTSTSTTAKLSANMGRVLNENAQNLSLQINLERNINSNQNSIIQILETSINELKSWKSQLTDADTDNIVNTLSELLATFQDLPEGTDVYALINSKINTSDIVNDLTSLSTTKVLSANQGRFLNELLKIVNDNIYYFLNPEEITWQDLYMPQLNEYSGNLVTIEGTQYPIVGFNNGIIKISDLPENYNVIEISGDLTRGGSGVLWLGGYNPETQVFESLIFGDVGKGSKTVFIDRDRYKEYFYSRDLDTKFRIGTKISLPTQKDAIKKYIDEKATVLDYFLNPEEITWEDLYMPQPNEYSGNLITIEGAQLPIVGFNNGLINISDLPENCNVIEISGDFTRGGSGVLWLAGYNTETQIFERLLFGNVGKGSKTFFIDRDRYKYYIYSRDSDTKFRVGTKISLPIEKDSVKNYIDEKIAYGTGISSFTSAQITRPTKVLRLDFKTNDAIPVDKTTKANGTILLTDFEGLGIKKFATIEVQGSSSAAFPKKNWTLALYNDEAKTSSFKLRVGNWAFHSEFVFKSNWIDATHARNLLSNQIWEDIVQSRSGYPKRENEIAYVESYNGQAGRFDSGALTHVDGIPAEMYINGEFYGIGNFNLGKKRENYDLVSTNQNHIQLAAEVHINYNSYISTDWEIRNPKTPDSNFNTKINAWFSANALTGQSFKDNFQINHDLKNAIDFFLLCEFLQANDLFDKNFLLTTWNGVKFYFLPYDLDTTFGMQFDGESYIGWTTSIRSVEFWDKFYNAYSIEIKQRYSELKSKGVFSIDNIYKHADNINKIFGVDLYKKEQAKWTGIPSNSVIYTGFPQIYEWTKNRLIWLDSQYN